LVAGTPQRWGSRRSAERRHQPETWTLGGRWHPWSSTGKWWDVIARAWWDGRLAYAFVTRRNRVTGTRGSVPVEGRPYGWRTRGRHDRGRAQSAGVGRQGTTELVASRVDPRLRGRTTPSCRPCVTCIAGSIQPAVFVYDVQALLEEVRIRRLPRFEDVAIDDVTDGHRTRTRPSMCALITCRTRSPIARRPINQRESTGRLWEPRLPQGLGWQKSAETCPMKGFGRDLRSTCWSSTTRSTCRSLGM